VFLCGESQNIVVEGYWNRELVLKEMDQEIRVVWTKQPMPPNHHLNYFMSKFCLQLNYLTDELEERLPPTDSRRRPDQTALEMGNFELAAEQKHLLE
jgi:hypothetical protein